jgi:hypothetical protein
MRLNKNKTAESMQFSLSMSLRDINVISERVHYADPLFLTFTCFLKVVNVETVTNMVFALTRNKNQETL